MWNDIKRSVLYSIAMWDYEGVCNMDIHSGVCVIEWELSVVLTTAATSGGLVPGQKCMSAIWASLNLNETVKMVALWGIS